MTALADDRIDKLEEHTIRRASDLLYLSHSRFIEAKIRAKAMQPWERPSGPPLPSSGPAQALADSGSQLIQWSPFRLFLFEHTHQIREGFSIRVIHRHELLMSRNDTCSRTFHRKIGARWQLNAFRQAGKDSAS